MPARHRYVEPRTALQPRLPLLAGACVIVPPPFALTLRQAEHGSEAGDVQPTTDVDASTTGPPAGTDSSATSTDANGNDQAKPGDKKGKGWFSSWFGGEPKPPKAILPADDEPELAFDEDKKMWLPTNPTEREAALADLVKKAAPPPTTASNTTSGSLTPSATAPSTPRTGGLTDPTNFDAVIVPAGPSLLASERVLHGRLLTTTIPFLFPPFSLPWITDAQHQLAPRSTARGTRRSRYAATPGMSPAVSISQ